MNFRKELANITRYRAQLRKLFDKLKVKGQLFEVQQENVEFFSFGLHEAKVSQLLKNAVLNENYQLQPALERIIVKNNKQRKVYIFQPTDKLVIAVLIKILFDLAEQTITDSVYSYRQGITILQPVTKLSTYLKQQLSQQQGVYVFKTDIANYTDNIRLDDQSRLWTIINRLFEKCSSSQPSAYQWQLIKSCFRPLYKTKEGTLMANIIGAPTGAASSTLAYNLYACDIDEQMASFDNLFYARYSDDIILAHSNVQIMEQAVTVLHAAIYELGLQVKLEKEERLYLNPAAHAAPTATWQGCNKFTYLGHDIYGSGEFLISTRRQRKFLRAIERRINHSAKVLRGLDINTTGRHICKAINAALLDKGFAEFEVCHLLAGSHKDMLRHLDYQIALRIAEAITQQAGPRAFRQVPYKTIREEWRLLSLYQLAHEK